MARSQELEKRIVELYQSGLSMAATGQIVGRSAATVLAVLKKYNIESRTKGGIQKLPVDEILKKYEEDKRTLESIASDYGVTLNTIKKVIIDNNGTIRTSSQSKNPYFKENYFENIDTEAKAYFLGFLITDGSIASPDLSNNHPNYRIRLELQTQDSYILESLKKELSLTSTNLYYCKRIRENQIFETASLNWYSTKMAQDLSRYGVIPNKTSTVYLPSLKDNLMPHLIRGMIDGDGSITITHIKGKPHLVVYFCGNKQCVTQVRDFLVTHLDVYNVKVIQASENLWQISWANKKDTNNICQYLYKDANFYLTRKFNKYQSMIENTEVT